MKHLKYFILISIFFGLVGHSAGSAEESESNQQLDLQTQEEEFDAIRDQILSDSNQRHKGPICKGDDYCENICHNIYNRRDWGDCEDLSVSQVEKLVDIYELLEAPEFEELKNIDTRDFEVYLNVSTDSLEDLVFHYGRNEALHFIFWLSHDPEVARILRDADRDFEIFQALMGKL